MQWNFNPRSREGSDSLASSIASCSVSFQSTLPRRERRQRFVQNCLAVIFQSTLPRRERLIQRCLADPLFIFQSTLPRRERLRRTQPLYVLNAISIHAPAKGATKRAYVFAGHVPNFNPRSREGSDRVHVHRNMVLDISIHAPAKGATKTIKKYLRSPKFQSTLPRRERQHLLTSFRLQYGYSLFHLTNKI